MNQSIWKPQLQTNPCIPSSTLNCEQKPIGTKKKKHRMQMIVQSTTGISSGLIDCQMVSTWWLLKEPMLFRCKSRNLQWSFIFKKHVALFPRFSVKCQETHDGLSHIQTYRQIYIYTYTYPNVCSIYHVVSTSLVASMSIC